MPRARIFVTGGTGRLGPALISELLARGYRVRATTSASIERRAEVEWISLNFMESLDFGASLDDCDAVLHLAAEIHDQSRMQWINVEATARLAAAAERAAIRFFGYVSSMAVYGSPLAREVCETSQTVSAERDLKHEYLAEERARAYGRSKLLGEQRLTRICRDMECVIVRPTYVCQADELAASAAWPFRTKVIRARRQTHYLLVDDFVDAVLWLMERGLRREKPSPGVELFNISNDDFMLNTFGEFFRRAYHETGERKFAIPFGAPEFVDVLNDLIKYRTPRGRLPGGSIRVSSAKLLAAGYRYPCGAEVLQRRALGLLRNSQ